jgi:hypothetical protein
MLWFNACPHCSTGTAEARSDHDGRYMQCLTCSWTLYAPRYGRVESKNSPVLAGTMSDPEKSPETIRRRKLPDRLW